MSAAASPPSRSITKTTIRFLDRTLRPLYHEFIQSCAQTRREATTTFGLPMASITAALVILTSTAIAEPVQRSGKARKTISPPIASPASNDGYYVPYVTGADGEKHPIMEIPGSVTVISRQLMDDQQATTLGDALRNVSGVTVRR